MDDTQINGVDFAQEDTFMESIRERLVREREVLEKKIEEKKSLLDNKYKKNTGEFSSTFYGNEGNQKYRGAKSAGNKSRIEKNEYPLLMDVNNKDNKNNHKNNMRAAKDYEKSVEGIGKCIINNAEAAEGMNTN